MGFIGTSFPKLESWLRTFSIELFAHILQPAWIDNPRAVVIKMSNYAKKGKSA
jgi:hypothetical protein